MLKEVCRAPISPLWVAIDTSANVRSAIGAFSVIADVFVETVAAKAVMSSELAASLLEAPVNGPSIIYS